VSGCMLRSVTYELQAGGNTLRSLVVRTTPSGAVEVELPRYKEVCASEMCLFGIEVSPPIFCATVAGSLCQGGGGGA
jgi:hypothetical protein